MPVPFEIRLPTNAIQPRRRYALQGRIEVDGQPQFISTDNHPVFSADASTIQEIILEATRL